MIETVDEINVEDEDKKLCDNTCQIIDNSDIFNQFILFTIIMTKKIMVNSFYQKS